MRLFIGLALPETVRQHLMLLASGIKGARWQRDDQLHITLRFLGEVDGAMADDVDRALAGIAMEAFTLSLSGIGIFGSLKAPRILWAGVEPEDKISRLYEKVERSMVRLGLLPEGRKFHPHVTLARFTSARRGKTRNPHRQVAGLADFLETQGGFQTPPFEVENFILYSSHLGSEGSSYRIEAQYPLVA